jgi:iron complex transport system ATP-binding protein
MQTTGLELCGVSVELGGAPIISAIDLSVSPGEFVAVVGPNGAGKSTLMRSIYRSVALCAGSITLEGEAIEAIAPRRLYRRMSVVTQEHGTDFEFTVGEIVALGRIPYGSSWGLVGDDDRRIIDEVLQQVEMSAFASRRFATLSGGEKQRVLLARALAQQPDYLLLDEPTNHLDIRYQLEMVELVSSLGVTVVAALHDLNLAAQHADAVVMVNAGVVHSFGLPDTVFSPDNLREVFGVRATPVAHPVTDRLQLLFDLAPSEI